MSLILTTYLHEYRGRLHTRAHHISLKEAIDEFRTNYDDHTRGVSRNLDLIRRYRIPYDHAFAQPLLREARFSYLLAYEDLRYLGYLAKIHPGRRSHMERQFFIMHDHLMKLGVDSFHRTPQFSPPPRSA